MAKMIRFSLYWLVVLVGLIHASNRIALFELFTSTT